MLDLNKNGVHLRELSRITKTSCSNLIRNLKLLEKNKIIKKEKEANLIKIKLNNHPLTIAYLKEVHTLNFLSLPKKVILAVNEFLNEIKEKPIISFIFGSYAKGGYTENSDIDLMLIFQKTGNFRDIENTARRISSKTNTRINPVYAGYKNFESNLKDKKHVFSNEIKKNIMIINGIEYYYQILWNCE